MSLSALEAFYLSKNPDSVERHWTAKVTLSQEILQRAPLRCLRPESIHSRTRLDLMFQDGKLGIRGPTLADGTFEFFEVRAPDSASHVILEMLDLFLESRCPLKRAQLRFRESMDGHQGLWIDTANEEIKHLLDEGQWLIRMLMKGWVIEAGQKHKEFTLDPEGKPRFQAALARPWLASFSAFNDEIPLLSYASLFSQPGPECNRAMIAAGFELLDRAEVAELPWAEWGAGYGNLTAAYATRLGPLAFSSELDAGAYECLETNGRQFFPHVTVARLAAEKAPPTEVAEAQTWVIDPPRSGFSDLLRLLSEPDRAKPPFVLAYHCHEKGLSADCATLKDAAYRLIEWSCVDAFPATPHHEVVSIWSKS